ncbi:MAG: GAF domain-containing protein [Nonlabens sp.]
MGAIKVKEVMNVCLSFSKVLDQYRARLDKEESNFKKLYLSSVLQIADKQPELIHGIKPQSISEYKTAINAVLGDLFPSALTHNELKAAVVPFSDVLFNATKRLERILQKAGEDFELKIMTSESFDSYQVACGVILNQFYGQQIEFSKPILRNIPQEDGFERTYRVTFNADFIDVIKQPEARELTQEDINTLLRNPEDADLWESYIPFNSYTFKGFGIISMTDVTMDVAVSDLKTILLDSTSTGSEQSKKIQTIFRKMFGLDQLRVGYTSYDRFDKSLETIGYTSSDSFILGDSVETSCSEALCKDSYDHLIHRMTPLVITDVEDYRKSDVNKFLTDNLLKKRIKSAILYPITKGKHLIGILEVVSKKKYALNSFNLRKIENVADYIRAAVIRSEQEYLNSVKALIQTECTSIHHSVQWKFEREAKRILSKRENGQELASFTDVRFPNIYPLYGQIDIVGSSDARNDSIKNDLISQLDLVCNIFAFAKAEEPIPIYDQISYRVKEYQDELKAGSIDANSERDIIKLLTDEINPIMTHLKGLSDLLRDKVLDYQKEIDPGSGVIYNNRNNYDMTVQNINENLSAFIDSKQKNAQKIYPHYFERFKTDGVEHNIYVGPSIAPEISFNIVYLYNLRLWQLKTMIEMEHRFYSIQKDYAVKVEAASMILVFDNTLSIRYRIDEKRFDVDGTYNARYEVIKKRIDKANIKNTKERITQRGKLAIIYTNGDTEREYMRYVNFLQHKNMVSKNVEFLKLEDVQGVIGLKAIRISLLYDHNRSMKPLTYSDMIKELHPEPTHSPE